MNTPTPPDPNSPVGLAGALLSTLRQEREALGRLSAHFERQLDAIRNRQQDLLAQATLHTNEEVGTLTRLRQTRERQMRLLGRILRMDAKQVSLQALAETLDHLADGHVVGQLLIETRTEVRSQAEQTQQRCRELEFALQYAVQLGREMLQAMQGLDVPAPSRVYTAEGGPAYASSPRSLMNRIG